MTAVVGPGSPGDVVAGAPGGPTLGRAAVLGMRLRWRLTRNRLRKGGVALFVVGLVGCVIVGFGGFATFAAARTLDTDGRRNLFVVALTLLTLGWTFIPLTYGGADETLDPTRLALLPLRPAQLASITAGAAACSPASFAVLVALIGIPVGVVSPHHVIGAVLVIMTVPAVFFLGLGMARLAGSLLARAQRSRKGRDLAVIVSGVAGVSLWLASQSIGPLLNQKSGHAGSTVVRVFSWFPPGWAARAVMAGSEGRDLAAAGWFLATATSAALAVYGWARVSRRMLTASERVVGVRADDGRPPLGRASGPRSAAVAKELRYLRRSPGKRVQFVLGTCMGVGFTVIQVIQLGNTHTPRVVLFGLWGVVFTLGGSFNVIGFDAGSLWLDVVTGGLGRDQLFARTFAWLPLLLLPPTASMLIVSIWTGQWRALPVALALAFTAATCGLGVAAFVSTIAPIPYTDGDNPFAWRQGAASGKGCVTAIYTFVGLLAVALFGAPIIVPCAVSVTSWWALPLALVGMAWGCAVWSVGVRLGARRLVRRGPELLAELSARAVA